MFPIKILLVEGDSATRERTREHIREAVGKPVIFEAQSFEEARALADTESPRVTIIEIALEGEIELGLEAVRDLRRAHPQMRIIVYSICSPRERRGIDETVLQHGANAFVPKTSRIPREFVNTVEVYSD